MAAIATDVRLDESALSALRAGFRGELVRPGDPTYHERRNIWNGSIDRHPALIARCAGVADHGLDRGTMDLARADCAGRRRGTLGGRAGHAAGAHSTGG